MAPKAAFSGLRLEFLVEEKKGYAAAVVNGTKNEAVLDITRHYFKRFPPDLDHNTEPSEAHLAAVNDALPDPEPEVPDPSKMSQEQYKLAMEAFEQRKNEVVICTAQIERWLVYRHGKQNAPSQKSLPTDPSDPMFVLTCRLLGKSVKKPRKPIPYNVWGKDNRGAIKHAYASAPKDKQKQHDIGTETSLKQALFEKQPESIQKKYRKLAQKSHKEMMKEWSFNLKRPASTNPESRQVCIDGITSFMQPILDLVVEFTGMRVTFMMGGPEPATQGRMNIIALHSGLTKGPVKVNFGQAESEAFQSKVVPVFSDFLRKCFTREDAQAAALPVKSVPMLSILDPTEVTYCEASGMNFNDLNLGDPKGSGSSSAAKDTQDKRASKQSSAKSSKKPSAKSSNESKKSSKKPATSKQSKRKGKKATSESDDESQSEDEDEDDDQKEQLNPSSRRNSSAKSSNTASKKTVASSAKSSNTSSKKTGASKGKGRKATSESDDESQSEEEDQDADGATDESDDEEHPNPSRGRKLLAKSSTTPSKKLVASKQPKGKGKGKAKAKANTKAVLSVILSPKCQIYL
ncbi:hypothetical protein GALMADRAFT_1358709 [Galerina marginata CBS 339.88]|uniref:Uncharacterized protein n=1 Tax=Galerina marginata (strain CBS 339.88) TaxID=685588 RepID=A0A067SAZ9_GALM3|nr:hypothetical protein GALMADRAFT_1358709 [Galerina marginata CBS 339.88]